MRGKSLKGRREGGVSHGKPLGPKTRNRINPGNSAFPATTCLDTQLECTSIQQCLELPFFKFSVKILFGTINRKPPILPLAFMFTPQIEALEPKELASYGSAKLHSAWPGVIELIGDNARSMCITNQLPKINIYILAGRTICLWGEAVEYLSERLMVLGPDLSLARIR